MRTAPNKASSWFAAAAGIPAPRRLASTMPAMPAAAPEIEVADHDRARWIQAGQARRDRTASDGEEGPAEPCPPHDERATDREDEDEAEGDRERADLGGEHMSHEVVGDRDPTLPLPRR